MSSQRERVVRIRRDPLTRRWYLATSRHFNYDAESRSAVVLKAYDGIKLRDPTNPWPPPEATQRGESPMSAYASMTVKQLQAVGKERKLKGWHEMTKGQLIEALIQGDVERPNTGAGATAPLQLNPATVENVDGGTPDGDGFPDIPPTLRVDAAEQERRNKARKNEPIGQPAGFAVNTKPAAAAATPPKPEGKRASSLERTITVLAKTNPKRPGSSAHERFNLYKDGMTVAQFIAAGGTSADINFDQNKGFIRLSNGKH